MDEKINWSSVESDLNTKESANNKKLVEKNAQRRGYITKEIDDFMGELEVMNAPPNVEDIVGTVTTEIKDANNPQEALQSLRYRNLYIAMKAQHKIGMEIDQLSMRRMQLSSILDAQKADGQISPRVDIAMRSTNERIAQFRDAQNQLTTISPEAFIGLHLKELKKHKEQLMRGRLVETSYFQAQAQVLRGSLEKGRPTFIHGDLGTGKTEMALQVAQDYLMDLAVRRDFEVWDSKNPNSTVKDQQKHLQELKEKHKNSKDERSPYLISGSKHTSVADMYAQKTLVLEHLNGQEILAHNAAIEEEIAKWEEENAELKKDSSEEYQKKYELAAGRIADIYKEKNFAAGTAVKEVLNHVASAAVEGVPVIIDEVNAIPHETLISLNHLLTRRAGQVVNLPGVDEPITIKEGFAVVFTSNLNQGVNEKYLMREDIDPAFLSRLDLLAHDYLPQDTDGALETHANSEDAQLFHLILAMEIDEKGNVNLPEGDLEKLWTLAKFARKTQNIFSGKEVGKFTGAGGSRSEKVQLEKSVLSIRDIIRVLDEYDDGRSGKALDQALWEKFIAQATVPADQVLLYQEARNMGFFEDRDGWKTLDYNTIAEITRAIDRSDVHPDAFGQMVQDAEFLNARKVVELAYGKVPERTIFPDMTNSSQGESPVESRLLTDKDIDALENFIDSVQSSLKGIAAGEKEICPDAA